MFSALASILLLAAQTATSTLCQAENVRVSGSATTDLRLIGCGEGFPDNLLWHLDRADSRDGTLDMHVTRRATGKGSVVYMCDTGVWRDHDEFARPDGSAVIDYIAVNGLSGFCLNGENPALHPCWNTDTLLGITTHGTATASVVAGKNVGVAPDAKIVSVFMLNVDDNDSWIRTFDAIIQHAYAPGTPPFKTGIINMSQVPGLASTGSSLDSKRPLLEQKMRAMISGVDANGAPDPNGKRFLFVTIAGNYVSGQGSQCDAQMNSDVWPAVLGASIDGLISVGGIDATNHLWDRSCRGDTVDILAPAANMLVASISDHDHYRGASSLQAYPLNSGTSYAAPFIAGLAALLLEKNPDLTPVELERIIKSGASHVSNADEPTAGGRVGVFDGIATVSGRRTTKR